MAMSRIRKNWESTLQVFLLWVHFSFHPLPCVSRRSLRCLVKVWLWKGFPIPSVIPFFPSCVWKWLFFVQKSVWYLRHAKTSHAAALMLETEIWLWRCTLYEDKEARVSLCLLGLVCDSFLLMENLPEVAFPAVVTPAFCPSLVLCVQVVASHLLCLVAVCFLGSQDVNCCRHKQVSDPSLW